MHPLTDVWWELFINRTDGSLRWHGSWVFDPAPLTPELVSVALHGLLRLGVYAVDRGGQSRWLCLDADTTADFNALMTVAAKMKAGTFLLEPSRRGGHLWRLSPPTPWDQVRDYGLWLCDQAGITCEVFPKGAGRTGVKLPLTRHPKDGLRYPAIDPATGEIVPEEQLQQLRPAPLPVIHLAKALPKAVAPGEHQTDFEALYREIARVTKLRQYGPERAIGHCPFHDDRHPSLSVVGGFWRCWAGCGEGGLNAFRAKVRDRHLV